MHNLAARNMKWNEMSKKKKSSLITLLMFINKSTFVQRIHEHVSLFFVAVVSLLFSFYSDLDKVELVESHKKKFLYKINECINYIGSWCIENINRHSMSEHRFMRNSCRQFKAAQNKNEILSEQWFGIFIKF